ncbi:MAG: potassium channel family protein [Caldiserica bacterium]|nr:potassium channel family protein [Caldisericota bacterium]
MDKETQDIWVRLKLSVAVLILVVIAGTFGFRFFEKGNVPTLLDSFFFTLVTITTIGYGNITPQTLSGKILDIIVILLGVGTVLATFQTIFEVIVRKRIKEVLKLPAETMEKKNHFIVCGYGKVGRALVKRLLQEGAQFVVIENDPAKVKEMVQSDISVVEGDARQDEVLERAGIKKARYLLASLDDSYNVFIALTAKMLNPDLKVICKIEDMTNEAKLKKAGADEVVLCHDMGAQMMLERTGEGKND